MTGLDPATVDFILSIADDKHLMGQQHAEWIGVTPFLEEDLAFCSIGQDELGHAALLYEVLVGDDDIAIDALAYRRPADEYRSCWFVERASDIWAEALVRHWMYDSADQLRWALLADSTLEPLAHIAARVDKEERYHRLHSETLLDGLLASELSHESIRAAVAELAPLALTMFNPATGEAAAIEAGVASGPFAEEQTRWQTLAEERFSPLGPIDWGAPPPHDGRLTRSPDFAPLMARMREVIDFDLDAVW